MQQDAETRSGTRVEDGQHLGGSYHGSIICFTICAAHTHTNINILRTNDEKQKLAVSKLQPQMYVCRGVNRGEEQNSM